MQAYCSYQCSHKMARKPKKEPKPRACAECKKQTMGRNKYCSDKCSEKASKRRKKAKEKTEPKYWMKKADTLASKYYREKTPYCEAQPFHEHECKNGLQWCHVYRRAYKAIRYEWYNNLVMCGGAHMYFTHNPEEWYIFMQTYYPERWELATKNRHNTINFNVDYYQSWINEFTN